MATLQKLCSDGVLVRVNVELDAGDSIERLVFAYPKFVEWAQNVLPLTQSSIAELAEQPDEQVDALLHDFISGVRMGYGKRYKRLQPGEQEIWELKTADIRLFGWFARKHVFVITAGEEKKRLNVIEGLYGGYRNEAARLRDTLDLDPPKYIPGDEIDDLF